MAGNENSGRKANEKVIRQNLLLILDQLDEGTDRKRIVRVLEKLVSNAEEGDIQAINAIMDRVDGKPVAPKEISGPEGEAIPVAIKVSWG